MTDTATEKSGALVLWLVLSVAAALALGLVMVWINIERTNLGYSVRRLQGELERHVNLSTQLEVERDRLLSPYVLANKARELGMRPARAGQNRRLETQTAHDGR